jgi:decaprenylphospho-beta-D-erythro-pentofuranosid-2-ulose 2-reductase
MEIKETVFVVGATSSLAQVLCHTLAKQGYGLILAGRDTYALELLAGDLLVRSGANASAVSMDFLAANFSPQHLIEQAGEFQHVIIATGDMGSENPEDITNLTHTMWLNYSVPAHIATLAALSLSERNARGTITLISSVAGDRGRQSNYAYGSAKAALNTFASGLRNRFFKRGVHVMTVKPGFIDTPMTWGMNSPLIASREAVALAIIKAMQKRKNVVYVPFFWRYIMLIIMHIPEWIFKRLSL